MHWCRVGPNHLSHSPSSSASQLMITPQVLYFLFLHSYSFHTYLFSTHILAVTSVDYNYYSAQSTLTIFNSSELSCMNISIVDDVVLENDESFNVTLGRTRCLDRRITLDPAVVKIIIDDRQGVKLYLIFIINTVFYIAASI